jgi:uncharacterized protein (DUF1015 family)
MADRVASLARHLEVTGAETVPVTLTHRHSAILADRVSEVTSGAPLVDAKAAGVSEKLWAVDRGLADLLPAILYIADGHHRVAAAVERGSGFLALIVPADQLRLSAFNRIVLGAEPPQWLVERLLPMGLRDGEMIEPEPGEATVAVGGSWFTLPLPPPEEAGGRVGRFDAPRLHRSVLGPILGVGEDCVVGRLEPVPATDGLEALVGPSILAGFALAAPTVSEVLAVADDGEALPAKTTYTTPKPLAGVVVRMID